MVSRRWGFTIIEVSLFLAISGLLFFAVTIGVQSSIRQQRYNDSVQSFAEFLRGVYSEVLNVQNPGEEKGRSDKAIYGKLIIFGEEKNLARQNNNNNTFFVYSVVGDAEGANSGDSLLGGLKILKADIVTGDQADPFYGVPESYTMRWSAQIEKPCGTSDCSNDLLKGMVLIVRHPGTGMVNTFFSDEVVQVNSGLAAGGFTDKLGTFKSKQIDFCVNPEPGSGNNVLRRDVRIVKDARNTSGVEIIADDLGENACRKK